MMLHNVTAPANSLIQPSIRIQEGMESKLFQTQSDTKPVRSLTIINPEREGRSGQINTADSRTVVRRPFISIGHIPSLRSPQNESKTGNPGQLRERIGDGEQIPRPAYQSESRDYYQREEN